jgi:hypothetical protein
VRTTKSVVARVNELAGLANWTETKGLVGNQLIGRETVVQLNNLNILGSDSGILED